MNKNSNNKNLRFQAEVTQEFANEMAKLQKLGKFTSKKDVMIEAFMILEWVVEEIQKGNVIASIDKNNKVQQQIVTPFLRHLVRNTTNNLNNFTNQEKV